MSLRGWCWFLDVEDDRFVGDGPVRCVRGHRPEFLSSCPPFMDPAVQQDRCQLSERAIEISRNHSNIRTTVKNNTILHNYNDTTVRFR